MFTNKYRHIQSFTSCKWIFKDVIIKKGNLVNSKPFSIYFPAKRSFTQEVNMKEDTGQEFQFDKANKSNSTYSEKEINKFRAMSNFWWNTQGEFKPLHSLNKLRVALIRDGLLQSDISLSQNRIQPQPLKGLRLLDVGCGGGILSEPLARLGAHVTGLDAVSENIAVAILHAEKNSQLASHLTYVTGTIEDHVENLEEKYDGIIASEVIEHVESPDFFIDCCVSALKPGGSLFLTTINKTRRSWLGAIVMAEYVLGLIPRGTHDWNKFIGPRELRFMTESAGCKTQLVHGMMYIPGCNKWFWSPDSSVNYALHVVKLKTSESTSS